ETLEKILSFAEQGVIVVGEPPAGIATLSGGEAEKTRFRKAVEALWGDSSQGVRKVGKGNVYTGSIESALTSENIQPDINVKFDDVRWLHRKT
ncbi:glycosyl hydrolase, partial [Klebsiella pneumoniae]